MCLQDVIPKREFIESLNSGVKKKYKKCEMLDTLYAITMRSATRIRKDHFKLAYDYFIGGWEDIEILQYPEEVIAKGTDYLCCRLILNIMYTKLTKNFIKKFEGFEVRSALDLKYLAETLKSNGVVGIPYISWKRASYSLKDSGIEYQEFDVDPRYPDDVALCRIKYAFPKSRYDRIIAYAKLIRNIEYHLENDYWIQINKRL